MSLVDRLIGRQPTSAGHSILSLDRCSIYDPLDSSVVKAEGLAVGSPRNKRLGEESAGIQPRQPRRGEVLFTRDTNLPRSSRALPYHPNQHPEVSVKLTYQQARTQIPPEEVKRSFKTSLHDSHTLAHQSVGAEKPVPNKALRKLGRGGGGFQPGSTLGAFYREQLELAEMKDQEEAAQPRNQDPFPEISW